MLALHRAGLLEFLGPGLTVAADEAAGDFVASSPQSGVAVRATAFIEARLPAATVTRSLNPLLRAVHCAGLGSEQQLLTADGIHSTGKLLVSGRHQLVDARGHVQDRIFGIGPGTSGWGAGAFARPRTNAAPFRENDALARHVLELVAGLAATGTNPAPGSGAGASAAAAKATAAAARTSAAACPGAAAVGKA
jgi:hypothetical protein